MNMEQFGFHEMNSHHSGTDFMVQLTTLRLDDILPGFISFTNPSLWNPKVLLFLFLPVQIFNTSSPSMVTGKPKLSHWTSSKLHSVQQNVSDNSRHSKPQRSVKKFPVGKYRIKSLALSCCLL